MALDAAPDPDEPGAHHHPAVLLQHLRPDDDIGDAGLVLDGHEDDALGGARALAHQHHAARRHEPAVAHGTDLLAGRRAALAAERAQELHGMAFERQAQGLIVVHHMLRHRHFWEGDGGSAPLSRALAY